MIVVAIIGILVAVAMPQYQNYVACTQVAEGLSLASGIKTAIAEYHSTHGSFPPGSDVATNHDVLGIAASTDLTGNYVWKIEVKSDASCLAGGTPSNRQIDEKYLPSSCLLASNFDVDSEDPGDSEDPDEPPPNEVEARRDAN